MEKEQLLELARSIWPEINNDTNVVYAEKGNSYLAPMEDEQKEVIQLDCKIGSYAGAYWVGWGPLTNTLVIKAEGGKWVAQKDSGYQKRTK